MFGLIEYKVVIIGTIAQWLELAKVALGLRYASNLSCRYLVLVEGRVVIGVYRDFMFIDRSTQIEIGVIGQARDGVLD